MPRLMRLPSVPFGYYYIVLRAESGRSLITNAADLRMFLELLRVTIQRKGAQLHAGCVMRNEVHLAIRSDVAAAVSTITRSLCHEYARRFNRAHQESGTLFRSRAHVLLIQHRLWLVPLAHFIHWIPRLQPLQGGADEISWSTDAVYRGRVRRKWLTTHVVLQIVSDGARRREMQEHAYSERFDKAPNPEHERLFAHGSPQDPRMLGDDEFIKGIWESNHLQPPRRKRVAPHNNGVRDAVIDVVQRFGAMCDEVLPPRQARAWKRIVTMEQLRSHSRKRPLPMIRAVSASYVIKRKIATRAQTASFFGCRPETLSAHRRRHYAQLLREWFGARPGVLLCSGRDGDRVEGDLFGPLPSLRAFTH
jgi:REP element-mobilizing transposase RayT